MKKIMKLVSISVSVVILFLMLTDSANAAISIPSIDSSFDINVIEVGKIAGTEAIHFFFEPTALINPQNISYFKIRVYCDSGVSISVNGMIENSCGKAVKVANTVSNKFFLSMLNSTGKTIGFSFKLKAYDKNGKWLHSEKQSFNWK